MYGQALEIRCLFFLCTRAHAYHYFSVHIYSLDNVLGNVDVSLAEELEANYSEFWKLMKKAGLVENINGEEVMTFIVGETVMAFLPDNDVVKHRRIFYLMIRRN